MCGEMLCWCMVCFEILLTLTNTPFNNYTFQVNILPKEEQQINLDPFVIFLYIPVSNKKTPLVALPYH